MQPKTPGKIRLETPAGLVNIEYKATWEEDRGLKVKSVKLTNVPSYLHAESIRVDCAELGELMVDVSYGGNFYAIVDVQENFNGLEHYTGDQLISWARTLRKNINAQ